MSRGLAPLFALALLAPSGPVGAEDAAPAPPPARELLERAFHNLYADDYVQMLVFETRSRGGSATSRRLQLTRKRSQGRGRALLRFLEPADIRRTAVLVLENPDRADDLYVYLPAARMTRHLGATQRADSFFGTDLSYEDVEPKRAEDWEASGLAWGEHRGAPCARIEIRPRAGFESSYERLDACVEVERGVLLWSEFHRGGRAVKRLEVEPASLRRVGTREFPFAMTFSTPARGSETRVLTESYELRPEIPEELFSAWNLEAGSPERDRARSAGRPGSGN
jgi:hypothetical protein